MRLSARISWRFCSQAIGTNTRLASVNRQAAMAIELAPTCANRIKIEDVDTANMAKNSPARGETTGLEEVFTCSPQIT